MIAISENDYWIKYVTGWFNFFHFLRKKAKTQMDLSYFKPLYAGYTGFISWIVDKLISRRSSLIR